MTVEAKNELRDIGNKSWRYIKRKGLPASVFLACIAWVFKATSGYAVHQVQIFIANQDTLTTQVTRLTLTVDKLNEKLSAHLVDGGQAKGEIVSHLQRHDDEINKLRTNQFRIMDRLRMSEVSQNRTGNFHGLAVDYNFQDLGFNN